jgi:predicted RNA-binding protein YlxR (DUF448 family)
VRIRHAPGHTIDLGAGAGRGAWLCAPPRLDECFDEALRRAALDRALRTSISRVDVAGLRAKLDDLPGARP